MARFFCEKHLIIAEDKCPYCAEGDNLSVSESTPKGYPPSIELTHNSHSESIPQEIQDQQKIIDTLKAELNDRDELLCAIKEYCGDANFHNILRLVGKKFK